MADHVLEEELRPALRIEISGPVRNRPRTDAPEEIAAAAAAVASIVPERKKRHHTDPSFLREREDRVLDAGAIAHVVIDADEVDRLIAHDRLELRIQVVADHLHSDVPHSPRFFLLHERAEMCRVGGGVQHDEVELRHIESRQ